MHTSIVRTEVARRSVTPLKSLWTGERLTWEGCFLSEHLLSSELEPSCQASVNVLWSLREHFGEKIPSKALWFGKPRTLVVSIYIKDQCVFKTHQLAGRYYLHSHMMPTEDVPWYYPKNMFILMKINDWRDLPSLSPHNIFNMLFISTVSSPLIFFRVNINVLLTMT